MLRKHRWIYSLLLLFVTSAVFADSSDVAITSSAVANHTDISMNYLSQIFGTVSNVLTGTSGQMLGKLFYELNIGILVVAGLWLSYSIFTLVLGSATEGAFVSGRNNLVLVFLKIAIGMAALFPSPTTGYSVIQDIVMKVVVQGVKLADMTWSNGLNYIQQGGAVWRAPATSKNGGGLSWDGGAKGIYAGPVAKIFAAEVCMVEANAKQSLSQSDTSAGSYNKSAPSQSLNPIDNKAGGTFIFPNSPADTTGGCGVLNWKTASVAGAGQAESEYGYQAAYHIVFSILPAAKQFACSKSVYSKSAACNGTGTDGASLNDDVSEILFNNTLAWVNSIQPLVNEQTNHAGSKISDFLQKAGGDGWAMAGRYSWDIAHLKDNYHVSTNYSSYLPAYTQGSSPISEGFQKAAAAASPVMAQVKTKFNNYADNTQHGDAGSSAPSGLHNLKWISPVIGPIIDDIIQLNELFSPAHMGTDPLYFVHRVGMMLMNVAADIWISLAVVVGAIYLIGIICSGGSVDLDKPINAAVGWIKPLLMAFCGVFITTGGVLAFYVPVYAFFIFTFGVISWFIAVIEAMACAPMIAFGLTHPEGHDFLGPAKQALILLLCVFLRPVLMVIGLISAMILSFVTFRMVNYGFASFMGDIFSSPNYGASNPSVLGGMHSFINHGIDANSASLSSIAYALIAMPVLITMYTTAIYLLVNQCYSLVYVLPDYVNRWIGGQPQGSSVAQMMNDMKGATQSSSSEMGRGASETGLSTTQAAQKGAGRDGQSGGGGDDDGAGGTEGAAAVSGGA